MSAQDNKNLVRRLIEEVHMKGNIAILDEVVDSRAVYHDAQPGFANDRESHKQQVAMFRAAFPDLQFTIEDLIADGDKVATRWTARGTHEGELMGIAPTGKPFRVSGITIDRINDGKVVEEWEQFEALSLLQQLGAA